MAAVPAVLLDPIWEAFRALIPDRVDHHPLGGHRPRIPDRVCFERLLTMLVLGASYEKIADSAVSATTLRRRRDEWIEAGIFEELQSIAFHAYDKMVGFDFSDVSVDGRIVKAPCGGESAGRSPVDRGKSGKKFSLMVDGNGVPLGTVIAGANENDSPLLKPTLDLLDRFGGTLSGGVTVHLDAGYDSAKTRACLDELGYAYVISKKGTPLQAGKRWSVERAHSWYNQGFRKLAYCTERRDEVVVAWVQLATVVILVRRLISEAWTRYRWDGRSSKPPSFR